MSHCQPGYHTHPTGRGGYTKCHPISDNHEDDGVAMQTAHQQALNNAMGVQEQYRIASGSDTARQRDTSAITSDSSVGRTLTALGFSNLVGKDYSAMIKTLCSKITSLKFVSKVFPVVSAVNAVGSLSSLFQRVARSRATESEKKGFAKAWNTLDKRIEGASEEGMEETIKRIEQEVGRLSRNERARTKGTLEHGQYMAYKQFLKSVNDNLNSSMKNALKAFQEKNKEKMREAYSSLNDEQKKFFSMMVENIKLGTDTVESIEAKLTPEQKEKYSKALENYKAYIEWRKKNDYRKDTNAEKKILADLNSIGLPKESNAKLIAEMKGKAGLPVKVKETPKPVPKKEEVDLSQYI